MATSFRRDGFGAPFTLDDIRKAFDQLRSSFDRPAAAEPRERDVRDAVLVLLSERPMHGYQLIHAIEERSGGSWTPTAGAIYPSLQLLVDEGYATSAESDGRRLYTLTESGRTVAAEVSDPWAESGDSDGEGDGDQDEDGRGTPMPSFGVLPKAGVALARAAAEVARTGTPEQARRAATVLDDARHRVYAILAED